MPRILVVGDLIRDVDVFYTKIRTVEGVPALKFSHQIARDGGAGAVLEMVQSLGAGVAFLCGQKSAGISGSVSGGVTVKKRVFVDGLYTHRIDEDVIAPISEDRIKAFATNWSKFDVVLVSDYGKGAISPELMNSMRQHQVRFIVDPGREADWDLYRGAACITANRRDVERFGGSVPNVANEGEAIIYKQDKDGMLLLSDIKGGGAWQLSAFCKPEKLVDPTGAGDMVLAALGVAIANKKNWRDAAHFANVAAGLKCMQHGATPVPLSEVEKWL